MKSWLCRAVSWSDAAPVSGKLRQVSASRAQKERTHPAVLAALHGLLGEKDRAFALLDRAIVERDPMVRDLRVSPMWDSLRTDPRFRQFLKRVNLD